MEPGLSCSPIGLGPSSSQGGYPCTPRGLAILGWEGVSGIHYGRICGYGDMVFAVNLMPVEEQHVRPLADSFWNPLRLFLACGSTTTLEQAGDWTRKQSGIYLHALENVVTPDAQAVLEHVASTLHLAPMKDPSPCIKGVQTSFDGGKLYCTDGYYDMLGLARPDRREPASQSFELEVVVFVLERE